MCERSLGKDGDGGRHFQHYPPFIPGPAHNRVQLSPCTQGQYTGHTWNLTSKIKFIKNMYMNVSHLPIYLWKCIVGRSEDNFRESVLSIYNVGPGDWTRAVSLGSKRLSLPMVISPAVYMDYYFFISAISYHWCVKIKVEEMGGGV